jgi:hypothetical protein
MKAKKVKAIVERATCVFALCSAVLSTNSDSAGSPRPFPFDPGQCIDPKPLHDPNEHVPIQFDCLQQPLLQGGHRLER